MIPVMIPMLGEEEAQAAADAVRSGWVAQGQVGSALGTGLGQFGTTRVIVPAASLAPDSSGATNGTWASTFELPFGKGPTATVAAADTKLSCEPGGDFVRETRDEVERYLASGAVGLRGRLQLHLKTAVAFGVLAASWTSLVLVRPGPALGEHTDAVLAGLGGAGELDRVDTARAAASRLLEEARAAAPARALARPRVAAELGRVVGVGRVAASGAPLRVLTWAVLGSSVPFAALAVTTSLPLGLGLAFVAGAGGLLTGVVGVRSCGVPGGSVPE